MERHSLESQLTQYFKSVPLTLFFMSSLSYSVYYLSAQTTGPSWRLATFKNNEFPTKCRLQWAKVEYGMFDCSFNV